MGFRPGRTYSAQVLDTQRTNVNGRGITIATTETHNKTLLPTSPYQSINSDLVILESFKAANMAGDEIENVKVAVRVRPFNKREIGRNAQRIIDMNGNSTKITNPADGESKSFTFDHSYWSFDGCKEEKDGYCAPDTSHPNGKKYCDQVSALKYYCQN